MTDGWDQSAGAWITSMGDRGDWGREHVLDPVMLARVNAGHYERALDVGCGEGRFCRMLKARGISAVGIDPTVELIDRAKSLDPAGDYQLGCAEKLLFSDATFDLVVSYMTLIDIPDFRSAIREMSRVLKPGGALLIANLNSFNTSTSNGWIKDQDGRKIHYAVDRYLEEFPKWMEWSGIRIQNWHRPLSSYMRALLEAGLQLSFFDEPSPQSGDAERQASYRRAPWYMVMEWRHR